MTRPLATTRHPQAGDAASGALPIVLVHGLSAAQPVWGPILEDVRALGEVITVDMPGFGSSHVPAGDWTVDGAADAIVATLDALDVERFVLVGHSLGGGVVMRLATRHPDRVAALVPIAPAGWVGTGDGNVDLRALQRQRLFKPFVRLGGKQLLRVPALRNRIFGYTVHDPGTVDARQAIAWVDDWLRSRRNPQARAAIYAIQLLDDLPALTMPVHFVWGADDRIVAPVYARRAVAELPDVKLDLLDGVGHNPMFERPGVVVAAIADAVRRAQVAAS